MNANNETIRRLAEALAHRGVARAKTGVGYITDTVDHLRWDLEADLAAVWPQVFPETVPPEGSVKVRVAVAYGVGYRSAAVSWKDAIPGCGDDDAMNNVMVKHVTHRGFIDAVLPPIPAAPIVQGTSIPAKVEVRDEA